MTTDAIDVVRSYLTSSGRRRIDEATGYLDSEAILVFPQGRFQNLAEMAAAMAGRYSSIGKKHETWEAMNSGEDTIVVTTGTLHGVNLHGVAFEGIRFCDRFVVRRGLIVEQHVWNDLAESGVLERR